MIGDFRRAAFSTECLPIAIRGRQSLAQLATTTITAWRNALQRQGADEAAIFFKMLGDAASYDTKVFGPCTNTPSIVRA